MEKKHIQQFQGERVHFIGIGGISMSGLAEILLSRGYRVSGSDLKASPITRRLQHKGAVVFDGHRAEQVHGADLAIHTAAVKEDNPEMVEARRLNIPVLDRAALLGQLMETYAYAVGVSGTHGKTTTTAMMSLILYQAALDPTILLGGELEAVGGNVRTGSSHYFITEACEYVDSFLKFHPYMAVILNIDADHLDYFKDLDHIYASFAKYAALVPEKGFLIGCGDDPLVVKLAKTVQCKTVLYGIEQEADWTAADIHYDAFGCASYRAVFRSQDMGWFRLKVPGRHNIYNALAAAAGAWALGISVDAIRPALSAYQGTHRRFEFKGRTDRNVLVVDDYAHHPAEIKATLEAAAHVPHDKLWCIFQPHTYTRTHKLFQEFSSAFKGADTLIVADIYAAREKDPGLVHARDLAAAAALQGQNSLYLPDFPSIIAYLQENAKDGDLVLTMGAGDIHEVGEALLGETL